MIDWSKVEPEFLTDAALVKAYRKSDEQAGDWRQDALAAELERRGLDV